MKSFAKRVFDLVITIVATIILSPVILILCVFVAVGMGRPILFSQVRPGLHGRPFRVYKFRTMKDLRDADGRMLPDHLRLTLFGRFLRSSSLDELPELFNVLKGEMSLVGPRPLLMAYMDRYTAQQARRHEALPGITGWAQINGRNSLSWEAKFELDVWYVDHSNLLLDLKILVLTVIKVLRRDGISSDGHATAPEFTGASGSGGTQS